jgi:hypothetical protein
MHRSIRRGLKRKEAGQDGQEAEYQAGLTQFQAAARKRESIRLKRQMGAAPGVLEKDLGDKIRVEESVCKVTSREVVTGVFNLCSILGHCKVPAGLQERDAVPGGLEEPAAGPTQGRHAQVRA